jgi:glycosyltransferase involved in cell wall biosynthesis
VDFFWLYRPPAPSVRAQAIQVIHMAHAMALRGHRVSLAVDVGVDPRATPREVLAFYGLLPTETLSLRVLPRGGTAASVAFRLFFTQWVRRTRGKGVVYARSKRYTREALIRLGKRFRLVIEAHEVDSAQASEAGEDPAAHRDLEAAVLAAADAVVTNAPGTLDQLRAAHPRLPPAVALHNATHASRVRTPAGVGRGIGYVGSLRKTKDLETLARTAAILDRVVHLVGPASSPELDRLVDLSGGRLRVEDALAHVDVPDRLSRFRVLVLPLADGLFGRSLTSPLKLWDYQASGVPMVGADLPSLHDAVPGAFEPYRAGDPQSLAAALERVATDAATRERLRSKMVIRTWAERAGEVDAFVDRVV